MKKTLIYILCIVVFICAIIVAKIYEYKDYYLEINNYNTKYEKYINNEVMGKDIASVINLAVDNNENERIKKDENGKYIQNDENSINIEVKITEFEKEQIYTMESLYSGGMDKFATYYGKIPFKASKVEYNNNKRIKYIMFEQVLK